MKAAIDSVEVYEKPLHYGTAGFRSKAECLDSAMVRCGIIAALRSADNGGKTTGVCVTASHNPECDNGVKIVEPDGGMMLADWEDTATNFVNCDKEEAFKSCMKLIDSMFSGKSMNEVFSKCSVAIGCDTRSSSQHLVNLVRKGIESTGALCIDAGVCTTPMLHSAVVYCNTLTDFRAEQPTTDQMYGDYVKQFTHSTQHFITASKSDVSSVFDLHCDAACGVGGLHIQRLVPAFEACGANLHVRNVKPSDTTQLNHLCGAEYVQKKRKTPVNFGNMARDTPNTPCFALDGDADRVVFFLTQDHDDEPVILDGDRIAAVVGDTLCTLAKQFHNLKEEHPLTIGVIQTAYANGASTHYLKSLVNTFPKGFKMTVEMAKTGVKHLHHKALAYDIGIYFESNGHGTIICNKSRLDAWAAEQGVAGESSFASLVDYIALFNPAIGDAIADAIAFVASCRFLKLTIQQAAELYPDYAVVQNTVRMSREKLNTLKSQPDHELWLVSPTDFQQKIDSAVKKYDGARAFVRASGTEDVCRVYAEAKLKKDAETLAEELTTLLQNY